MSAVLKLPDFLEGGPLGKVTVHCVRQRSGFQARKPSAGHTHTCSKNSIKVEGLVARTSNEGLKIQAILVDAKCALGTAPRATAFPVYGGFWSRKECVLWGGQLFAYVMWVWTSSGAHSLTSHHQSHWQSKRTSDPPTLHSNLEPENRQK